MSERVRFSTGEELGLTGGVAFTLVRRGWATMIPTTNAPAAPCSETRVRVLRPLGDIFGMGSAPWAFSTYAPPDLTSLPTPIATELAALGYVELLA